MGSKIVNLDWINNHACSLSQNIYVYTSIQWVKNRSPLRRKQKLFLQSCTNRPCYPQARPRSTPFFGLRPDLPCAIKEVSKVVNLDWINNHACRLTQNIYVFTSIQRVKNRSLFRRGQNYFYRVASSQSLFLHFNFILLGFI